jgi:hypothetical protein
MRNLRRMRVSSSQQGRLAQRCCKGTDMPNEPQRARALFSTEDFGLMKEAVGAYVRQIADDPKSTKFSNLYHRLGRVG